MLRWLQSGQARDVRRDVGAKTTDEPAACPGLARALKRILAEKEQPEVLDLGQFSRSAALYLAQRGARVHVEDFVPPPPTPKKKKNGDADQAVVKAPVAIPQPDHKFDLVLAWEHFDFVPPDRLPDFTTELSRVLAPGGWLLMYAQDDPGAEGAEPAAAGCYRLEADDRIFRSVGNGPARPRWNHPNRMIERALAPLAVQSIHLQRNRIREFLVRKSQAAS
jgi:SAM-dependent methyltransferase